MDAGRTTIDANAHAFQRKMASVAAWKTGLSLGVAVVGTAWTFAMMASETSGDGARWYDGRRWSWIVLPDRTVVVARDRRPRADGDPSRLLVEPRRPFESE